MSFLHCPELNPEAYKLNQFYNFVEIVNENMQYLF